MELKDFLQIYKNPLKRLEFSKVKLVETKRTETNKEYFVFFGVFKFDIPKCFENKKPICSEEFINQLHELSEDFSVSYEKTFTRKIKSGKETDRQEFNFVFDFKPQNIQNFCFSEDKMFLVIKGYGQF